MPRYLVVANRTLVGGHLLDELRALAAAGDAGFHVVVPAGHDGGSNVWTEGQARAAAAVRLEEGLRRFAEEGIEATGEVGDADPIAAVVDATLAGPVDGIVLSTLPPGPSRWLRQDLPHRLARRFPGMPVRHVVVQAVATG